MRATLIVSTGSAVDSRPMPRPAGAERTQTLPLKQWSTTGQLRCPPNAVPLLKAGLVPYPDCGCFGPSHCRTPGAHNTTRPLIPQAEADPEASAHLQ